MPVRIVTDSACDLPEAVCAEFGIAVVPLTIRFGEREFVDRKELSVDAFWRELAASSVLPETAAPSVGAFEETFRRLGDEGATGIVCINLSAHLSATMQSAQVAAKALDGEIPIEIVDSQSASMGIGNLALHAARRARAGASVEEIVKEVEDRRSRQHVFAALDTLEYLRKGGRIGGAQALLGSVLSIKPVIAVLDGAVEPAGRVRTRSKALRFLVDQIPPSGNIESLSVLHANAPDLDEFLAMLRPLVPDAEVTVGIIGPVIGVHTGPRVMGIAWIDREELAPSVPVADDHHDDDQLARRAARGDTGALDALLRRHTALVHGVCRRILGNADDALDATQEALLAIATKVGTFDGRARFSTWAYRVATNAALDEARRRGRRPVPAEQLPEMHASAGAGTDAAVADRLDVDAALAQLTPEYRAAVALRDLVGMDYAEIAEVLGIPAGTVRSRISRGRAVLADLLGNREASSEHPTVNP